MLEKSKTFFVFFGKLHHFSACENIKKNFFLLLLARHARTLSFLHAFFGLFTTAQTTEAEESCTSSWRRVGLIIIRLHRLHIFLPTATETAARISHSRTTRLAALEAIHSTPAAWFFVGHLRMPLQHSPFLCSREREKERLIEKTTRNLRQRGQGNN